MLIYLHQVKAITAKIRHRAYAIFNLDNAKKAGCATSFPPIIFFLNLSPALYQ
jgi:hypothetical protein